MIHTPLKRFFDRFRGTGASAVTIPSMDGALRPNKIIDAGHTVASLAEPSDLAVHHGKALASSGRLVRALRWPSSDQTEAFQEFDSDVACMASHPSGALAVGLTDGTIRIVAGQHAGHSITGSSDRPLNCITAMAFADAETLLICNGSDQNQKRDWKRDLMSLNASGSVWRIKLPEKQAECLAENLGFPFGVAGSQTGRFIVAESWRHRLVAIEPGRRPTVVLDDLPGYPARIARGVAGDFWLTVFAPRRQMVEFVLRERTYCDRMVQQIPEAFWIAPAMSSGRSFLEPLQGGAIKQLGVLKPWAPTLSYGLIVRMTDSFEIVSSLHSRADGKRHGLTSCVEVSDDLLIASEGNNEIISVNVDCEDGAQS